MKKPHTHTQRMGMKGHPESNCGGGGSGGIGWMKKKKMGMVAVVILVGLMGMMVVQKLKDRRLFSIVIKEKDHQIHSLYLLLQKERQYAKENKRKNQVLNARLYSLGTQKIELSNKMIEMRSTIDSLRDEQRVLELTIDEKQNQIKHKESEIKDIKSSQAQTPPKIWSVSSDDPSNLSVNLTNMVMNPDVKVQKLKDEKVTGSKDHKDDDAKIEMHNTTYGHNESQLKANPDKGPTDIHHETNRIDEDEAEIEEEADLDSSRNVSEADQDYKEETEV